jgi:hypothetical protein
MSEVVAQSVSLKAAADFIGNGAIETPVFESEITDLVRRSSVFLSRLQQVPATGHPHRYFEQLAIAQAQETDPRNISQTNSGPTRVERPAFIKAVSAQTNISQFDKDVTEQQGQFASVVAKDVHDIINAICIKRAQMLFTGTDTSLMAPTTLQWMGLLTQITQTAYVAIGASIIDAIKAEIALMVSNQQFVVRPTAIVLNSVLGDFIDREAKAGHIELGTAEVTAGVKVSTIQTQAGPIPLIPEAFVPTDTTSKYGFTAPAGGTKNYYAVIVTEDMIEIPVVSGKEFNPNPRLFQLGLIGNLAGQFVAVKFDTLIAKGPSYAHAVVCVNR